MSPTPVRVQTFWATPDVPADAHEWPDQVAQRLPIQFQFHPSQPIGDLEPAWRYAQAHPDEVVVVYTDQYYRGPHLNDRLEGFACGNIAVINIHIDCPASIVAHEIGHVLGLRHTSSGLMRARSVACDDQLLDHQSLWLKQRYPPQTDEILPGLGAETTDKAPPGNGDTEPAPADDVL
jgi:hypothetical protein